MIQPLDKQMTSKRVALVTGGTSGIGLAFAERLYADGYRVVVCGRDEGRLADMRKRLPDAMCMRCDVTDFAELKGLVSRIADEFGRLDLLVSNAGTLHDRNIIDGIDAVAIEYETRLNLTAPMVLTSLATPLLLRTPEAAIIFVTSGYALAPATRAPVYSAAKAGMRSFAKAIRRQLSPHGVRVIEVVPALVDTPSVAHLGGKKITPAAVVEASLAALRKGKAEAFVGQTAMLPALLRLAPSVAEGIVAKS